MALDLIFFKNSTPKPFLILNRYARKKVLNIIIHIEYLAIEKISNALFLTLDFRLLCNK